jgi:uncharacterized protein DUF3300
VHLLTYTVSWHLDLPSLGDYWNDWDTDNVSKMSSKPYRTGAAIFVALLLLGAAVVAYSQQNAPPAGSQPVAAPLPPQQLDDLVAPIALYPDPLVGQILAASTYPVEIAEAEQWVRDHPKWKPSKLMSEAKKESWDPSIQGLVAFPDVLARLSQDLNWTTQLGNAFLAQQADVMQAVQRMRASAQAKGTLRSTPQETVSTQNQGGQTAITIEPANPEVWYVPNYNPVYVWGPPVWGVYPPLLYPGVDVGFSFFPGIDLGLYFGGWGGWGWGGWGWGPNWFGGGLFIDYSFFNRFGFRGDWGGRLGNGVWAHDPGHRFGVPYPNREVAGRYARSGGFGGAGGRFGGGEAGRFGGGEAGRVGGGEAGRFGGNRGQAAPQQRLGSSGFEQRGYTENHSVFGGYHDGGAARVQSDRGFSSIGGGGRSFGGGGFGGGGHAGGGGRR